MINAPKMISISGQTLGMFGISSPSKPKIPMRIIATPTKGMNKA
jgi:hypothetical protein